MERELDVAPEAPGAAEEGTPSDSPDVEVLDVGGASRPARRVVVGFAGLLGEEPPTARVSVGAGPMSYPARVRVGDVLWVGPGRVEVVRIERSPPRLALRWVTPLEGRVELVEPVEPGPDGQLSLAPMAFYRLPSGVVLALGNVLHDGRAVGLSAFPPGYAADPLQDYDHRPRLRAGERLELVGSKGTQLELTSIAPPSTAAPRGQLVLTVTR